MKIISLKAVLAEGATEPVTLQEFKNFARHEWSGTTEWEVVEDSIDTSLLKAAREVCETFIRQNIVVKDVTCTAELEDFFPVPGGEVIGTITVTDTSNNPITGFEVLGDAGAQIRGLQGLYKLSYQSGMSAPMEAIKTAIKIQALFMYDNRTSQELAEQAKAWLNGFINYDHY